MFSEVFQSVNGINNYGLISTGIFFVFFSILVVYAISLNKKDLRDFSHLPFEDETKDSQDV
ncbi:MAG: CcoQ/FixQ family Cbb3-type cytochrome c oxidase assembly chaperone [Bacteroidota bacterium]